MNRFKIEAFFREFPFLRDIEVDEWWGEPGKRCAENNCQAKGFHSHPIYLHPDDVDSVKVSRISPEFLECQSWYSNPLNQDKIFLLDKEGKVLTRVSQGTYGGGTCESMETVGETLLYVDNPDDVVQAVKVVYEEHYVSITVYKAPRGFTLKNWVAEQERRAEVQIKAAIAEIDAETQQILPL